jgi:hypothetical protein
MRFRATWSNAAWVLVAAVLFLGTAIGWVYGDDHQHYSGFLVTLGWVSLAAGVYICRNRPSAEEMASRFSAHKRKIVWSLVAVIALYSFAGDTLMYIAPSTTYGYAWKYDVADSRVVIDKQPHNCEWETAPLGAKHCHYEAQVQWTRTGTGTDGVTPLVSYDGGKTWTENTSHAEPSVFVSWMKIEE